MQMDYKIVEEKEENGQIVYQLVRFYEGSIVTEDVLNEYGELVPNTFYKRTGLVEEIEYTYG